MTDDTRSTEPPGARDEEDLARVIRLAGPRAAVPPERLARLREATHASWTQSVAHHRRRRLFALAGLPVAAVAAVAAVVAGFWLRGPGGGALPAATVVRVEGDVARLDGREAERGGLLERGSGMKTASGGRAALRAASGASLRVDVDTIVRFVETGVLELERGAIYADTLGSTGNRGLEVRTRLGVVTDVGTQFEVRLTQDALEVSVRSGGARVLRDGRATRVDAGRRLLVHPDGSIASGEVGLDAGAWEWAASIAPPFDLEGRTLGDYLDWLARETGWRVTFADPRLASTARAIVLHGRTAGLRPADTPEAVLPPCGLRHRLEAGVLVIERSAAPGAP